MDKFLINGPAVLNGKIKVDGSKNAALPIIAAALLIDRGETVVKNVPPLRDIYTLSEMLEHFGARVTYDAKARTITINAENLTRNTAPYDLMRKMRGSFLVLGPLLARLCWPAWARRECHCPAGAFSVPARSTITSRVLPLWAPG